MLNHRFMAHRFMEINNKFISAQSNGEAFRLLHVFFKAIAYFFQD